MDFLATERHYLDHLVPVWHALEPPDRGRFYVSRNLRGAASLAGVSADHLARIPPEPFGGLIVSASWKDLRRAPQRPAALLEHGVGQTYGDRHPSNPGGTQRDNVRLFLCTNQAVADRNAAAYPEAAVVVVGCPKLDPYFLQGPAGRGGVGTVAVSFHWDNHQAPESRWAFPHYSGALRDIADRWPTLGHGHPRVLRQLVAAYMAKGIEPVAEFADVLERADLYVCDNSSTLYEFAATGRPVLCLNAPWYRRDVHHGLRFWDHVPGLECDEPGDLPAMVALALEDPPQARRLRHAAVAEAYTFTDGHSAERAAQALRWVVHSG